MYKLLLTVAIALMAVMPLRAGEGMWLPSLIYRNIEQMQQMGLQLSAEDLYNENGPSLKDAIVRFGRGCTGAFISDKGLVITNHHCGYGQIQRHSSVENDYLTHGFWAANPGEELPNDGLTVTILVRMEDVTDRILARTNAAMSHAGFQAAVTAASRAIAREASQNGKYETQVNPFYYGNQYYLFVYQVYRDVRMVGAPPSSIGKFGGDTDNWMWPRHSGDFMLFRVYADAENQPADYSPDNQPYQPVKHFSIAANTPAENNFTMVYGYPGRTQRYLTSDAVEFIMERENPMGITLRTRILQIYEQHMGQSDRVRIQYASKHAGISNQWKRWMGENRGLERLNAVEEKRALEQLFETWVSTHPDIAGHFEGLHDAFRETHLSFHPYRFATRLFQESGRNVEVVRFALQFSRLVSLSTQTNPDPEAIEQEVERMKTASAQFFRDYHIPIDRQMLAELTAKYIELSDEYYLPPVLQQVKTRYGTNTSRFAEDVFKRSFLVSEERTMNFLNNFRPRHVRRLMKDPAFSFAAGLNDFIANEIQPPMQLLQNQLDSLYRVYTAGLMVMYPDSNFFPDANSTLRITFGKVEGSFPRDAVQYLPFTTANGILERNANTQVADYRISKRLSWLLNERVYGPYAHDGELVVNFIASNHTTGGNSGSPVVDAMGNFKGINFDRSWESTMSDIMFDPAQCRNISVSSPYILWVIDQYAGMGYLLDEMNIVWYD